MYSEILSQLDLAKNEAILYEALLRLGEASAGTLSTKSHVNRRNVYDSLSRLVEKGLVFEIRLGRDLLYRAVNPKKLLEKVDEKRVAIEHILPGLLKLYQNESHQDDVYIYRGLEGWKNCLRDILQVGQDVYTIGGKGGWNDPRLQQTLTLFRDQSKKQKIFFHFLFDHGVKLEPSSVLRSLKSEHRFLPKTASTQAAIDIFGDHVVISSMKQMGVLDETASFTVVLNQAIADAFRVWFKLMWEQAKNKVILEPKATIQH